MGIAPVVRQPVLLGLSLCCSLSLCTPALPFPHTTARGNASPQPRPDTAGTGTEHRHGPSLPPPPSLSLTSIQPGLSPILPRTHTPLDCAALWPPKGRAQDKHSCCREPGKMKGWGPGPSSGTDYLYDLGERLISSLSTAYIVSMNE